MMDELKLTLYGRLGRSPQLVLRKKNVLYRMARVLEIRSVECKLHRFGLTLQSGMNEPLVMTVVNSRGRQWLIEAGMNNECALLCAYEKRADMLKSCFKWKGEQQELVSALKRLRY